MPKYPLIFLLLLLVSKSYALELELNQKVYAPNDKLVIFGKAIPNDSLILELFNPTGNLIYRTQIDTNSNGEFADIVLIWPEPDEEKFRIGTYTLVLTSSINREFKASEVMIYQIQQSTDGKEEIPNKLSLELSLPSIIEVKEEIPIIVYVTLNDTPLVGVESIIGQVKYPNTDTTTLENFISTDEGLYEVKFSSNMEGYHSVVVKVKHGGLIASKVAVIKVNKIMEPINKSVEMLREDMNKRIDILDERLSNNTLNIKKEIESTNESIKSISPSIGQLTSLLLPIIGMIAVIVALQATILAKRQ
ncbi:MAG: hypothetical protein QXT65_07980 [Candidatus Nitrosocaldaceae archaeon]